MLRRTRLCCLLLALFGLAPTSALAEDGELRLMREPTSFTDVIDAGDDEDPFDLNIRVAFSRSRYAATLQRDNGAAAGVAQRLNIGEYEHVRNVLEVGFDIGIYKDVMLYGRLPLVLSDTRNIGYPSGGDLAQIDGLISENVGATGNNVPLYYMPFEGPTRSGLDSLRLGLAFDIVNQARRPSFPTWLMLFEAKLGIGTMMNPCDAGPDGNAVARDETGAPTGDPRSCDAGVSTGTHALKIETRISRRYRYAEVYSGLGYTFQWAGRAQSRYEGAPVNGPTQGPGNLAGFQNIRPPMLGTFTAGISFVPWEHRGRWQRFSIDLRGSLTYVSEGRDYSPLYDALGSSQNPYLTRYNLEQQLIDPNDPNATPLNPADPRLRRTYFNGLTDVQAHGRFGAMLALEMQAAQYIRFRFGTRLDYISGHALSFSDACNPNATGTRFQQATCANGIINPHHRAVIDLPGQRFYVDGGFQFDFFLQATAQF